MAAWSYAFAAASAVSNVPSHTLFFLYKFRYFPGNQTRNTEKTQLRLYIIKSYRKQTYMHHIFSRNQRRKAKEQEKKNLVKSSYKVNHAEKCIYTQDDHNVC